MKLKASPLFIDPSHPFGSDLLGRSESAEILTEFVRSYDGSLVLSIDAPWGAGKTTFLKMWKQHLSINGFHTLYFNAWENDFTAFVNSF